MFDCKQSINVRKFLSEAKKEFWKGGVHLTMPTGKRIKWSAKNYKQAKLAKQAADEKNTVLMDKADRIQLMCELYEHECDPLTGVPLALIESLEWYEETSYGELEIRSTPRVIDEVAIARRANAP
jgi:hypothetical protein